MTLIVLLFLAGVLLLALEVLLPGAVLGILGGLAMVGGIVVAFGQFGLYGGLLALAIALLLIGVTLYVEFVFFPGSRLAKMLSMSATVSSVSQPPVADLQAIISQQGETITPLAPSGYVQVGGRRYEAFSRSGFLGAGVPVQVSGLDNFKLIVTKSPIKS